MMQVYQTRYEDGVFIGIATADPDPLEPGRYAIPGACVVTPPPPFSAGQRARFADGAWIIEADPVLHFENENIAVLFAWDGESMEIIHVLRPSLQADELAVWNGDAWDVRKLPPQRPADARDL
jgi:hypothetical protein